MLTAPRLSSHPCFHSPPLFLFFVSPVRHAESHAGRAEAHPVPRLPGSLNDEGHWEHYHLRGGEFERDLGELPDRVWRRWVNLGAFLRASNMMSSGQEAALSCSVSIQGQVCRSAWGRFHGFLSSALCLLSLLPCLDPSVLTLRTVPIVNEMGLFSDQVCDSDRQLILLLSPMGMFNIRALE